VLETAKVELNSGRVLAPVHRHDDRRVHQRAVHHVRHHGRPVQLDPIKPTLKALGIKRLKRKYHTPLSSFAFKFNLRRCTMVPEQTAWRESFNSAFRGGAVMGFALAGLGLLVMYFLMCLYVSAFEVCYTDRPSAPAYHQHVRYFPSLARRFARGL